MSPWPLPDESMLKIAGSAAPTVTDCGTESRFPRVRDNWEALPGVIPYGRMAFTWLGLVYTIGNGRPPSARRPPCIRVFNGNVDANSIPSASLTPNMETSSPGDGLVCEE